MKVQVDVDDMQEPDLVDVQKLAEQLGYTLAFEDLKSRHQTLSRSIHHKLYVARTSEARVIGWIHVGQEMSSLLTGERADIGALIVDSEHRSNGVGRLLLEKAEAWARSQGLRLVRVRSNTKRTDAHRFYQREGYQQVKAWNLFTKQV